MNRVHAFGQLILTRVREFYREPEVLFWVYGFPLILATVLGIAFANAAPVPPSVDIEGHADDTRADALAAPLKEAGITVTFSSPELSRTRFKMGKTDLVIVPEPGGRQYVFDPARDKSVLARYWVDSVLTHAELRDAVSKLGTGSETKVTDAALNVPGSRYIDFLLPGLVGINIMGGGLFGVGFVLVDMRVRKLFKRLMATPIHRGDFLLAILSARMLFLLPEMLTLLVVGWFLFSVPVKGSLLALFIVILLGAFAFAGLGLLLGCRTDKTESISGLINLVMLPMYLVSGVFFPSERFPDVVQPFIRALPLSQLNDALRQVMLEGLGLESLGVPLAVLAAWAVVTFTLALRWFRWR